MLTFAIAFASVAAPPVFGAREIPDLGLGLTPGRVDLPVNGRVLHDDVLGPYRPGATVSAALPAGADREDLGTSEGFTVRVITSPYYEPSREVNAAVVEFLDALLHGFELHGLTIYIAPPGELSRICGTTAAACYSPREGRMYIAGVVENGGIPTSYAIAHEYGHRIADYRHNTPFPGGAIAWGTKRWASVKNICRKYVAGRLSQSTRGRDYFRNAGEAFAESYAWYQGVQPSTIPWRWLGILRPNVFAYAAIERDVLVPWRERHLRKQGFLARPGRKRVYRVKTSLDGRLQARLLGQGDLDLFLLNSRNQIVARSVGFRSRERINYLLCGERRMKLVVLAYRAPANFHLFVDLP